MGGTYLPGARASSGLAVIFSIDPTSSAACSIDAGGLVSFDAPGPCTTDATQGGSADYAPAAFAQVLTVYALGSLVLSPTSAALLGGGSVTFTAIGVDPSGERLGDVSASTAFSIAASGGGAAGGSCTGSLCTASAPGTYTITGVNGSVTATTTLTVLPPPSGGTTGGVGSTGGVGATGRTGAMGGTSNGMKGATMANGTGSTGGGSNGSAGAGGIGARAGAGASAGAGANRSGSATVVRLAGTTRILTAIASGPDRFSTAEAVAKAFTPRTVFEATGLGFADAISAGPAAVANKGAILLTDGDSPAPATVAYLALHGSDVRYAVGGPAPQADPKAIPLVGADRFDTSARVAGRFFPAPPTVGLPTGLNFPDALAAAPLLGAEEAPVLLVGQAGSLPGAVASDLDQLGGGGRGDRVGRLFGGQRCGGFAGSGLGGLLRLAGLLRLGGLRRPGLLRLLWLAGLLRLGGLRRDRWFEGSRRHVEGLVQTPPLYVGRH